jgi:hypothetical protein
MAWPGMTLQVLRQSKLRAPINNLEKQVKTYKTRENKTE